MTPTLYGGVYQSEYRHLLSGSESCPCLQLFPEGVPAAGRELTYSAVLIQQQQFAFPGDSTNRCETHAAKRIRQEFCFSRRHGEQQFVVISAMEREMEGIVALFEGNI